MPEDTIVTEAYYSDVFVPVEVIMTISDKLYTILIQGGS